MSDDASNPESAAPQADGPAVLKETRALLESILEGTHDAMLVLDLERRIVRYNSQFLQMFRFTAEELDREGSAAIVDAITRQLENPDELLANSREMWRDPSIEVVDVLRFKDGRVYHRYAVPYRVDGRIAGRVSSYRDITQRVNAQQALEQHRAFLEKAQEVAHIGSWVSELDGSGRLAWSREMLRIFGVDRDRFSGTSSEFMAFVHPDDREFIQRASDDAVAGLRAYDVEHRIVLSGGSIRWMHERADIVRNAEGQPVRMVGTCQDITDRRQLEEQLRQSQKLEALGRLAGGIAHDLNNALTAIAGYTELALGALADQHPARADVDEIRRAAERAEAVTRQLLAFSRKQVLEPRLFSLVDVVANLGRLLERLLFANIQVRTQVDADVPAIYGDPGQIEQAIINLAVNARDAMRDGGLLTLSLSTRVVDGTFVRTMTPGRYVELSVADTGEGMSPETQAHVFEPFFTTKAVGKGTGLGLAMVYGTVRQSGGHIFVESEVGRGTIFTLYFPDASFHATSPVVIPTATAAPSQQTILVVDDEPSMRNLVVAALGHQGYRLLTAASAEEALTIAEADTVIDLLLTDVRMPGIGGGELANRMVAKRKGLRVVVMSGGTDDSLRFEGSSDPMPLLPKPFTPRGLRRKVAEVLATPVADRRAGR